MRIRITGSASEDKASTPSKDKKEKTPSPPSSSSGKAKGATTPVSDAPSTTQTDPASSTETPDESEAGEDTETDYETSTEAETIVESDDDNSKTSKAGKSSPKSALKEDQSKKSKDIIGKINNLLTTDVGKIGDSPTSIALRETLATRMIHV